MKFQYFFISSNFDKLPNYVQFLQNKNLWN